jgi:hypothetical protein
MKCTKMYCDHCGKEIDEMIDFYDSEIEVSYKRIEVDLCATCLDNLYDIVCDFCGKKGGEG